MDGPGTLEEVVVLRAFDGGRIRDAAVGLAMPEVALLPLFDPEDISWVPQICERLDDYLVKSVLSNK